MRLQLLLGRDLIFRFRIAALRLPLLLGRNSTCRLRIAAVTIVPGFSSFFRTLWSYVFFLWGHRGSENSGSAVSEIGGLVLDFKILSSDGISVFVLVYSGVNARGRRVWGTRRERDCDSTATFGEHCKSSSEETICSCLQRLENRCFRLPACRVTSNNRRSANTAGSCASGCDNKELWTAS